MVRQHGKSPSQVNAAMSLLRCTGILHGYAPSPASSKCLSNENASATESSFIRAKLVQSVKLQDLRLEARKLSSAFSKMLSSIQKTRTLLLFLILSTKVIAASRPRLDRNSVSVSSST